MKPLIAIFLLLVLSWVSGLYLSSVKTKQTVRDFYRWAHNDPSMSYDSFSETTADTATQLFERFKQADQPFKKHVRIGIETLASGDPPWPSYSPSYGAASNGSGFGTAISMTSTHYSAYFRTEKESQDEGYGGVVVAVETSLFGF